MKYIDGYILAVPKNKINEYKLLATKAGKLWKKHGAIEYYEAIGDDLNPKWAGIKFTESVKAKPSETVVFSFVIFKSKKHRDLVNNRVMKDPSMSPDYFKDKIVPFDMKRIVYGGFKSIVEYS